MKKLLVLIGALLCTAGIQAQGNDNNKSLLWKISGKEMQQPSYLFGTIHIVCKDNYVWTKTMKKSFEAAQEVCMEMDMDDPSILMQVATAMIEQSGKKLEDYFTREEYQLVEEYFRDSLGVNITMFATMKPIVLQTLLTSSSPTCDSVVSYEVKLSETAKEQSKEITGLETPSEQIKLLDQIPVDSIVQELVRVAKGHSEEMSEYKNMIKAYTEQDIEELHNLIMKSKEEGDNMDAFLDERNEKWIDRMAERMDQKSVFFAVGAGHLWGEKGLIHLLRSQGYSVEPMK
jgi:uncharacterized protein YbaP (TraB family)